LSVTCFIDTARTLVTPTCSVTRDNSIADGTTKGRDSENIWVGVRKNIDLRFMLYLTTLIVAYPVAPNDWLGIISK